MARIAVVGAGAVGLLFGGALTARPDHEVLFCARRPFARVRVGTADPPVDVPAEVLTEPAAVRAPADIVIVATKAHHTPGAAAWLERLCGPSTTLVMAQNGLEQEARGRAAAPSGVPVLPAVTYCAAERVADGEVRHAAVQPVKLVVPSGALADDLRHAFEGTFASIEPVADWASDAWRKLALNVATAGILAVTGRRSEIVRLPGMLEGMMAILDECLAVASACGATIDGSYRDQVAGVLGAMPPGLAPSMLQDRLAGRPTEYDALYGAVVRAAAATDVRIPRIRLLYDLLGAIDHDVG